MRVHIDPDVCQGHTLCHMAAPDIFLLREEDGHSYVAPPKVPASREEGVRTAVATDDVQLSMAGLQGITGIFHR